MLKLTLQKGKSLFRNFWGCIFLLVLQAETFQKLDHTVATLQVMWLFFVGLSSSSDLKFQKQFFWRTFLSSSVWNYFECFFLRSLTLFGRPIIATAVTSNYKYYCYKTKRLQHLVLLFISMCLRKMNIFTVTVKFILLFFIS